jgi:hypothetical protein
LRSCWRMSFKASIRCDHARNWRCSNGGGAHAGGTIATQ